MNKIITDDKLSLFKTNFEMGDAYGVCSTAAETTAKTVSITGFKLRKGSIVGILFEKSVMAGATLNIQSTGAKAIWYRGSAVTTGIVPGGSVVMMMYDGTRYNIISIEGQEQYVNGTYDPRYVVYELEKDSNPQFSFIQRGSAADTYVNAMGGYLFWIDTNDNNKVYAAKLNPSSWDKFADGTEVTAAIEQATETMVHVPDCYFKGEDKKMIFGGLTPVPGGHKFDSPNWVGAYKISYDANSYAHSRPDVAPKHSQTMTQFWTAAQNLGAKWGLANYGFHCLINALYQARYGNLNSQSVIGAGFQASSWEAARDVAMGLLKSLGDGSGKVFYTDATIGDQYPVKLFGFEDLWGKLWEFRPGIRFYMDDTVRKAVVYSGNQVSNTAAGREFTCSVQSASGAYIVGMELGEYWDMIAQNVSNGGQSLYYCDGYFAASGGQLLYVGGNANSGALCGLSYAYSYYAFSSSSTYIGARLAFYGEPTIVSGAELAALASA